MIHNFCVLLFEPVFAGFASVLRIIILWRPLSVKLKLSDRWSDIIFEHSFFPYYVESEVELMTANFIVPEAVKEIPNYNIFTVLHNRYDVLSLHV